MAWDLGLSIPIRNEAHFGDRVVRCFAGRPSHTYGIFTATLARQPDNEALVADDIRLSYRQLAAEADRVAAGLVAAGIKAGDRVALLLGNRIEFVTVLLACLRIGAICVPLGTRLQTPEIAYILDHCGAALLVHEADLTGRLPAAADVPKLKHRFSAGGNSAGSQPFAALQKHDAIPAVADPAEEDTAIILYTSGTTGRPKGAMLAHFNIVHSALHFQYCMGLTPADRSLLAVPASHVTGLIAIIVTAWQGGGAVIMVSEFKARDFLPLAAKEKLTHTIMVPAMYNLCLLQPDFDRYDLSSWRVGGYGTSAGSTLSRPRATRR